MALESEHGIVADHAASVVGDLDQLFATGLDADLDARGAGVEGVLEHFLYDRRRTLDDLPCSDLVGDGLGEYVDAAHEERAVLTTQQWSVSQMDGRERKRGNADRRLEGQAESTSAVDFSPTGVASGLGDYSSKLPRSPFLPNINCGGHQPGMIEELR